MESINVLCFIVVNACAVTVSRWWQVLCSNNISTPSVCRLVLSKSDLYSGRSGHMSLAAGYRLCHTPPSCLVWAPDGLILFWRYSFCAGLYCMSSLLVRIWQQWFFPTGSSPQYPHNLKCTRVFSGFSLMSEIHFSPFISSSSWLMTYNFFHGFKRCPMILQLIRCTYCLISHESCKFVYGLYLNLCSLLASQLCRLSA